MSQHDKYAFPVGSHASPNQTGMTLRDYFAANAMNAILAATFGQFKPGTAPSALDRALVAYEMADAMLKAREA